MKIVYKTLALLLPLVVFFSLWAWPEDTTKTGEACIYCHVNPSGVGPLTPQGIYYKDHGSLEGWNDSMLEDEGSIDFDTRIVTMVEYEEDPAFSLMTAKVSARFPLGKDSHIFISNNLGEFRRAYLHSDLGRFSTTVGIQEADLGLRIYDHTSLLEDDLGFGTDRIDIGVHANASLGPVMLSGSVLNGAYPIPFRADASGISAYTARMNISPWDFVSAGVSAYHNGQDRGNHERTLFAGTLELRKGPISYSGEHILGRWNQKLIRGYHNALHVGLTKSLMFTSAFEFLDLDRDLSDSAVYRGQLGLGYRLNKNISALATYSYRWNPEDDTDRLDIYLIGDY